MPEDDQESGSRRGWLWLGLGLLAGVGLGGAYAWRKASHRFKPQTEGAFQLPGLRAKVEVWRDQWGVPHIYAENEPDLFFAQGFTQAQDRFWQMDLNRRIASGQISAIFGKRAFEIDRYVHRMGLPVAAAEDLTALDDESASILDAFCAGVNAFIEHDRLPVEFSLLRYQPERWRPLDTLCWFKMFAWSLSSNYKNELIRARIVKRIGAKLAAMLEPVYAKGKPLIIPPGSDYDGIAKQILDSYEQFNLAPLLASGGGSNNWVISGSRTASGQPLLANDPHLALNMPSVWYEMHLSCPTLEAVGATIPGMPGVALGHNRQIAWGATASMLDVQDLFIEQFNPENPRQYLCDGEWQEASVRKFEIVIKGEPNYQEETLLTKHGPVIADLPIEGANRRNYKLALQWVGYQPSNLLQSFISLNRARDWQEFRESCRNWSVPSFNMVYADRAGNIGYQLVGKTPVRKTGGTLPGPGWASENDWQGLVPYDELPFIYNPPDGLIITANNKTVGDEYRYHLSSDYTNGYRAQRIREIIGDRKQLTIEDCRQIQADDLSIPGRQFAALLTTRLKREDLSPLAAIAIKELDGWVGKAASASVGETIYQLTLQNLFEQLLGGLLGEDLKKYLGGNGPEEITPINSFVGRITPTILDMIERDDREILKELAHPHNWEWLMQSSFERAVADLARRFGQNPKRWLWGRLHKATFGHPLGSSRALRPLFNRGPYPVYGDGDTPAQMNFPPLGTARGGFEVTGWAVSYRQIIDLADFDNSRMCHTTGQSGSPFSPHYDDMIKRWLNTDPHPMLFHRDQVASHLEAKLLLLPTSNNIADANIKGEIT
jgi:penicillin amidase